MSELYNDGHFEHGLNISNSFPVIFNFKKTLTLKKNIVFFVFYVLNINALFFKIRMMFISHLFSLTTSFCF